MDDNKDSNVPEVDEKINEVVEEVVSEGEVEGKVADRPEKNYKAELERKNREIERLRQLAEASKAERSQRRDQNDMSTWSDVELKAIAKSVDPSAIPFKDQAEDLLMERKMQSLREKERMQERRALADLELRKSYPEALDSTSELAIRMEEVILEHDLQKSPAGRLAAAKIAAAELGIGRSKSNAKERKAEADRVARVKSQLNDGDRSKSSVGEAPKKLEDIERKVKSESLTQADGFGEALKHAGIDRSSFFSGPGYTGRQK